MFSLLDKEMYDVKNCEIMKSALEIAIDYHRAEIERDGTGLFTDHELLKLAEWMYILENGKRMSKRELRKLNDAQ